MKYVDKEDVSWDRMWKNYRNLLINMTGSYFWWGRSFYRSGIPDFRSVDGLYNQKYDYPPETILSHTFFMRHPEEFYRFYRDKMLALDAKPNAAHNCRNWRRRESLPVW